MATSRSFNAMLNEYLAFDLLMEETRKRNYVLSNIEQDNNWKGGSLIVPFQGASATSYKYGSLTADTDIAEYTFVRGSVAGYKEIWGTMKWNAKDLVEHGSVAGQGSGMVHEQTFLRNLPGLLEDFVDGMKQVVSVNLLSGVHFAKLTADATANDGLISVDHPERFQVDQKVLVDDDNSTPATGYVARTTGININTKVVRLVTTRGGSTVVDFSANNMTVAQNAKCYFDGAETAANAFTPLRNQLLSAANAGDATIFGQTKVDYPYLQAVNYSGALMTKANILETIFDAWTEANKIGKGNASTVILSYDLLGHVMKLLEVKSGPFRHVETKASMFGWTEITVIGVKGQLKIVGVQEQDSDIMPFLDWGGIKFFTNGGFRTQKDPEGKMYFTQRATTGYVYLVDVALFGEQVVYKPSHQAIVYGIPATLP